MDRRAPLFGLILVSLSACSQVPADVSARDPEPSPAAAEPDHAPALSPECVAAELSVCADACRDSTCLEWCAGQACVTSLSGLATCMDEAEQRVAEGTPIPDLEYEEYDGADDYPLPTYESVERQDAWYSARESALDQRWASTCHQLCVASLDPGADPAPRFCDQHHRHYESWSRLVAPVVQPDSKPSPARVDQLLTRDAILAENVGFLAALTIGTTAFLGTVPDGHPPARVSALRQLISSTEGGLAAAADRCVPTLSEAGQRFIFDVELGPQGEVRATTMRDGYSDAGDCVAELLARALVVPARVAREFPRFEVAVQVQPVYNPWGTGLDMIDVDSAYGTGGLGVTGVGEGGGGGAGAIDTGR